MSDHGFLHLSHSEENPQLVQCLYNTQFFFSHSAFAHGGWERPEDCKAWQNWVRATSSSIHGTAALLEKHDWGSRNIFSSPTNSVHLQQV